MQIRHVLGLIAMLGLAGCSSNLGQMDTMRIEGRSYDSCLAGYYKSTAESYRAISDWQAAEFFAGKAIRASRKETVLPESAENYPELNDIVRQDLQSAAVNLGTEQSCEQASAQVMYDCWLYAAAHHPGSDKMLACKGAFQSLTMQPAPVKSAKEAPNDHYVIYFEPGSAELQPEHAIVLDMVVSSADPEGRLLLKGHASSGGKDKGNLELARERAREIKKALVKSGMAKKRIKISASVEGDSAKGQRAEIILR